MLCLGKLLGRKSAFGNGITCFLSTEKSAGHGRAAQTGDIQVDKPVETGVQVDWQTEAARHFQREKAMHDAAQAANSMNSFFLAESVRRKHGPHTIHHLLRDGL